jgi:2-keto-4-pentenoate hydratase
MKARTGVHPRIAAALDAQLAHWSGERLQAGDRILSGSLTHVPVAAGDHVVAIVDELGSLEATITA